MFVLFSTDHEVLYSRIKNNSIQISLSLILDGNHNIRESIVTFSDMKIEIYWRVQTCILYATWAIAFLN
jgi:hypothetical protein